MANILPNRGSTCLATSSFTRSVLLIRGCHTKLFVWGQRMGITASFENVFDRNNLFKEVNVNNETRGNILDEVGEFSVPRTYFELQSPTHHTHDLNMDAVKEANKIFISLSLGLLCKVGLILAIKSILFLLNFFQDYLIQISRINSLKTNTAFSLVLWAHVNNINYN